MTDTQTDEALYRIGRKPPQVVQPWSTDCDCELFRRKTQLSCCKSTRFLHRLEPAEPNRDELPRLELPFRTLVDDSQHLFFRAHRKNEAAHWLELLK